MDIKFFDARVEKFIRSLDSFTVAKVLRTIDLLEIFGHKLAFPHSKKVAARLFELRIRGKQEVRVFYAFHNNSVILLHCFIKKSERIPKNELAVALGKLRSIDL